MRRSSADFGSWGLFMLLALIWGSSYLFIKIGLDEGLSPLTLVSIRTILGTAFLALVMRWQRARLPRTARTWLAMGIVGMTNIVIPYALITWGELHISSGMAGILTAMAPLFTVLLASMVLKDEPVTAPKVAGLLIGFGGVVILASPSLEALAAGNGRLALVGMVAVVLATFSYAVAIVYTRKRLSGQPVMREADGTMRAPTALEVSFGQVFVGMIVITALALVFERPETGLLTLPGTTEAWLAMVWLGLAGTGLAYLLYFALIDRWGATRAVLIAYALPLVAIVLGFAILGERLQRIELVGAALIISGVVLVNRRAGRAQPGDSPEVDAESAATTD
jgi:drug/metabolite transporter (DMT)-like permease